MKTSGLVAGDPIELWSSDSFNASIATGAQGVFLGGPLSLKGSAATYQAQTSTASPDDPGFLGASEDPWWAIDVTGFEAMAIETSFQVLTGDAGLTVAGTTSLRIAAIGTHNYVPGDTYFGTPDGLEEDLNFAAAELQFASMRCMAMGLLSTGYPAYSRTLNNYGGDIAQATLIRANAATPTVGHFTRSRVYVGGTTTNNSSINFAVPDTKLPMGGLERIWMAAKINSDAHTGSGTIELAGRIVAIPFHRMVDSY